MAKKQFKAESKRLLDLMINSIYTHKEIFLRELISNSSDAIDKLYYKGLTEKISGLNREMFKITIDADKANRILTISDNGIGMTAEELEKNLGTIAKSGSLAFKNENEAKPEEDIDIIGQFGVGFYSGFMVSDNVTVKSKAYGANVANQWVSNGADGYTISECEMEGHGTEIILHIKEDTEEENYGQYLEEYKIRELVTRYSDYIRYPIEMMVTKQKPKEGTEGEFESYSELETLNSQIPIWKKNKSELKDEDYNDFYKTKFYDFADPAKVIHSNVEGVSSYTALMFIPSKQPMNYFSKDYEKGLQLYSSGVMIMDKCADLLPDYFGFVKGLVDSQDLSLNISREMLQHDRQLKAIAKRLESKIKSELVSMMKNHRDKYEEFWANFGLNIKFGVYDHFGMNKDKLQDLLLFYSSMEGKLVSLDEYITKAAEDQKVIYYATGSSNDKIDKLPQVEFLKDKGFEILYLTDEVDEFALSVMREYEGKEFKNVSSEDIDISESAEEKEAAVKQAEDNKELLEHMAKRLEGKASEVKLTHRLKSHPVCLSAKGDISLEMEKVLNNMPDGGGVKAQRVLEVNANHQILETLATAFANDKETVDLYTDILYDQALLIEGLPIEDPVEFGNKVCKLMK
ncbi:MAG: molecular chaperone HtpG [Anaerovoracaceae bacterium]